MGNYQQKPIGTIIGGDGMAGIPHGPSRGRSHPHYIGVITMTIADMPKNNPVFAQMQGCLAQGENVLVPIFADHAISKTGRKLSLGTGIGAGVSNWKGIQKYLLTEIYALGQKSNAQQIPANTYWPDLSQTPVAVHWIKSMADIKNIITNVL